MYHTRRFLSFGAGVVFEVYVSSFSFSVPDDIQRWRNLDGKERNSAIISELQDKIQYQTGGMNISTFYSCIETHKHKSQV